MLVYFRWLYFFRWLTQPANEIVSQFLCPHIPKSPPDLWSKAESKSDGGIGCVHGMEGCQLVTCDFLVSSKKKHFTRWWFQRFLIFTPAWGRFPMWLIFFKWVETTNYFRYISRLIQPYLLSFGVEHGYFQMTPQWNGDWIPKNPEIPRSAQSVSLGINSKRSHIVDGSEILHQLRLGEYARFNRVSKITGDAGFLNHQQYLHPCSFVPKDWIKPTNNILTIGEVYEGPFFVNMKRVFIGLDQTVMIQNLCLFSWWFLGILPWHSSPWKNTIWIHLDEWATPNKLYHKGVGFDTSKWNSIICRSHKGKNAPNRPVVCHSFG